MREQVKIQLLQNLLTIVTEKYDQFTSYQNNLIKETFDKAVRDPLTKLYNREFLKDIGKNLLSEAKREKSIIALIFVDVDNFKSVNDVYGHDKGDEVLKGVAKELKNSFRDYDIIVRYGGDEFIVLLKVGRDSANLENILHLEDNFNLEKNLQKINERIKKKFEKYEISISFGIATTLETYDLEKLIEIADARMYEDKKNKKANR